MKMRTTPLIGILVIGASGLMGQLSVTTLEVPQVIGFNEQAIPNVYRYALPGTNGPSIAEPNNWGSTGETGRMVLSSLAWAYDQNGLIMSHPFQADANNNGDIESRFDIFQISIVSETYLPALGANNFALRFNENTWADKRLTLKVVNNTGVAVNQWQINVDTWFQDTGLNPATLNLLVGTTFVADATGYTLLGSRAGTNSSAGFSAMSVVGGVYSQTVAPGDALYVQLFYDQNGNGTAFVIDNLSVTAVPEPAMAAGLLALVSLLLVGLRRRRN